MDGFFAKFVAWFYWYFRPFIKWFLHQTTRLTELQRHCYGEPIGAPRSCSVENSLRLSRSTRIQAACKVLDDIVSKDDCNDQKIETEITSLVTTVLETKKIKKQLHIQFIRSLKNCSKQIWGYQRLKHDVEVLRATQFEESLHVRKLESLWAALMDADKPFVRKSKQWGEIGFQGDDPKTDFRGMGMLGLENLLFFVHDFDKAAKHILSHSHHPKFGYSMAIVSINLTHMALKLLNDGSVKSHMYNVTKDRMHDIKPIGIYNFHHFYSYLFIEFDQFWLDQKPENIMEFNRIRDLFENNIRTLLEDKSVCLKINLVVDAI